MTSSTNHPGAAWFFRQPLDARAEAARRHSIMEQVRALHACGYTRTAAIYVVAAERSVHATSIWRWHAQVNGVVCDDDRMAQLVALCPRRRAAA